MVTPPEYWVFALSNVMTLLLGTVLAVISYRAYRRERESSLLVVAAGFALLTLGTVVEALYEAGFNGGVPLFGKQLFLLRAIEGLLLAAGLVLFIYSLRYV